MDTVDPLIPLLSGETAVLEVASNLRKAYLRLENQRWCGGGN